MAEPAESFNPFPGLRPFGPEEEHLFFGREQVVDQLLRRLRETRFLSVIGSSGSGKSSLVRAGLIPSLHGGYMTAAGSSWRVAVMRPGSDPIGNLASALNQREVLGQSADLQGASPILTEVTLRRSKLGLVECVRLARLPPEDNLLIIVDQFEELFRFKRRGDAAHAREEAIAFVKKLLSVALQCDYPIYVILTMRSDFIGECNEYPGLTEAINRGQFLVPRMTRDELRKAISGPILVAGAEMAPRLLVRLLNEVGDDPDLLPVLQHALMRTWHHWQTIGKSADPIDVANYEAIGTIEHALSDHADEAFEGLPTDRERAIVERVFKSITDTKSDESGVRRPTSAEQLCQIADCSLDDLTSVVEPFRQTGRSFLMPPEGTVLESDTVIDISHESLMRVWDRLIDWTDEERRSTQIYQRIARAATRYDQGTTGLWRDPDLGIALRWREENQPTRAWAKQYDYSFSQAMAFLEDSRVESERAQAAERSQRRNKLRTAWGVAFVLLAFALYALVQQQRAEDQKQRAEQNYQLAVRAVDEMLTDVAVEKSLADIPQTEELRQNMLEKGRAFFETLQTDSAADPDLRLEAALAQVRLGRIYELQGQRDKAESAHLEAISQLSALYREYETEAQFQYRLSEAYNWLGEHLRQYDSARAEAAYDSALGLQQDLVERFPDVLDYRYELGRTYNNRGISIGQQTGRVDEAERSYNRAIEVFTGLRQRRDAASDILRLARSKNNLAILLRENGRTTEAETTYRDAIDNMRELVEQSSQNREYREDLARMYNNLANLQLVESSPAEALESNDAARTLFEGLATPVPGLRDEIANTYNSRGRILNRLQQTDAAAQAYATALQQYEQLELESPDFTDDSELNQRFGNTLANLAILDAQQGGFEDAVERVTRAIEYYKRAVASSATRSDAERSLFNAYWLLADTHLKSDDPVKAVDAIEAMSELGSRVALTQGSARDAYARRTVDLLRRAVDSGYPRALVRERADDRFAHLRNRQDFQELIGDILTKEEQ